MSTIHGTVLIVDDNQDVVDALTLTLESHYNLKVVSFTDPVAAFKEYRRLWNRGERFQLAILDAAFPSLMTGFELAKRIREFDQRIFVVIFTGHPHEILDKMSAKRYGVNLVSYKTTVDFDELMTEVVKKIEGDTSEPLVANGQAGMLAFTRKECVFALVLFFWIAVTLVEMTWRHFQATEILKIEEQIISAQKLEQLRINDTREDLASYGMLNKNGPYKKQEENK